MAEKEHHLIEDLIVLCLVFGIKMMLIGILFLLPPEKQDINAYFNEIKLDIVTIVYLDQEGLGELKQSQSVTTTRPFRYALGHLHELITALHS